MIPPAPFSSGLVHFGNAFIKFQAVSLILSRTGKSRFNQFHDFPPASRDMCFHFFPSKLLMHFEDCPFPKKPGALRTRTDIIKRAKKYGVGYGGNMDSLLHRNLPEKCTCVTARKRPSSFQKGNHNQSVEFSIPRAFSTSWNARKMILVMRARGSWREKVFCAKNHGTL